MGRYKEGGSGGTGTGTVEEVTGAIGNGFEVEVGNDPTVNPEVGVKLNPTLTANTVLQSNSNGDGIDEATETGTGSVVKATAPTIVSPVIDTGISGGAIDNDDTFASPSSTKVPTTNATKNYIDNKVAGLSWKASVRAATTVAGTLASDFENGDTIDGVVLATGDRILIKNQASATENGIYIVAASGAPTRSTDANTGAELVNATVLVNEGTVNAETQWTCSTNAPITIGVTNIVFAAINVGTYSAGNGLSQSGNQFSINTSITADLSTAQTMTKKTIEWAVEPGTDDTAYGEIISGILAGDTIAQWDLVYLDSTSGRWEFADADAVATAGGVLLGLALTSGTDGGALSVLIRGIVRNDGWTWTGAGKKLYASTTAGAMTETAPSGTDDVVRPIADTLSDDCILFAPGQFWQVHT